MTALTVGTVCMALIVPNNVNSRLNVMYLSGFLRLEREEGVALSRNISMDKVMEMKLKRYLSGYTYHRKPA